MVVRCTARGAWSLACPLVAAPAIELLTPLGMRAAHVAAATLRITVPVDMTTAIVPGGTGMVVDGWRGKRRAMVAR
jgi:hypothetical protein